MLIIRIIEDIDKKTGNITPALDIDRMYIATECPNVEMNTVNGGSNRGFIACVSTKKLVASSRSITADPLKVSGE